LEELFVSTVGIEVIVGVQWCNNGNLGHCGFITVTSYNIVATMTLDAIVVFVIPFEQE
jgi:hypothetical protein